ncbi:hypothetical protein [Paractinoplanes ferrugineus]|uniref:hypothetical protein n=1 Tax=Paractinoplanes ferrugineus TaxID=113564 RepID=UPI0019412703|nr:hypothetical protein [Actinoplanes ferrugineus]
MRTGPAGGRRWDCARTNAPPWSSFLDERRAGARRALDALRDADAADRLLPATEMTVGG